MLKWVDIPEKYLDYLRVNGDKRIPFSDYGNDKYKPFFGILFTVDNFAYVTQVSHPQKRHLKLTEAPDFKKIYIEKRLICVVNLNYMFPVPLSILKDLEYSKIDQYRTFKDNLEKSQYIQLLRKEMQIINNRAIDADALALYNQKIQFPEDKVSLRCLDFKRLENVAGKYTDKQLITK